MFTRSPLALLAATGLLNACSGDVSGSGVPNSNPAAAASPIGPVTSPIGPITGSSTPGTIPNSVIVPAGVPVAGQPQAPVVIEPRQDPPAIAPPPTLTSSVALRRLTARQFSNSIQALLGVEVDMSALEVDTRATGLFVTDAASATTSLDGVERYQAVAEQAVSDVFSDEAKRSEFMACGAAGPGPACTEAFLQRFGRLALRRSLTDTELQRYLGVATNAADLLNDPVQGLRWATTALLQSPKFLYRAEVGSANPAGTGPRALTSVELASKLSFFLHNGPPDDELLTAAETEDLTQTEVLRAQAERLLALPQGRRSVSGFARDLFWIDRIDEVAKDQELFEAFTPTLREAMKEEFVQRWEGLTFDSNGGLADVFTSRQTFVNRELAEFYGIEAPDAEGGVAMLPEDTERVGILGTGVWLSLMAEQKEGSPTLRGKFIREALLCVKVPDPPEGVDTALAEVPNAEELTKRERLAEHASSPACAACHALIDPLGFGLEHFDAVGAFRTTDNDKPVDASGTLDGVDYNGLPGLAAALGDSVVARDCMIKNMYRYATGNIAAPDVEQQAVARLVQTLEPQDFNLRALLVELALSDGFRWVDSAKEGSN